MINQEQLRRMTTGKGFIAALDQSGGSTMKTLGQYGVDEASCPNEETMFDLVHQMRTRIIKSPVFSSEYILGAILFKDTMNRKIDDQLTADYLWQVKEIVPFLKVDEGLAELNEGVQLMKPFTDFEDLLALAKERRIFGTKMRSVIKAANPEGIKKVVVQQFELGKKIVAAGLVPIIEPEVDINIADKEVAESLLKTEILAQLETLNDDVKIMLKLSIPTKNNFYVDLTRDPHIVRVVALSGGYEQNEANEKLAHNHEVIASFSRALLEGLRVDQSETKFNEILGQSIKAIYEASVVKK